MSFQKGGIMVQGDRSIYEEVNHMLNTRPMEHMNYQGLRGNIYLLRFNEGETTPFIDLETNEHVRSFIVKIVLITDGPSIDYTQVINDAEINKKSVDETYFRNESKTQQYVWAKSIITGTPLCPPIVETTIVDSSNISEFSGCQPINDIYNLVMPTSYSGTRKVGIMVMPMINNNPMDLYDFKISKSIDTTKSPPVGIPNMFYGNVMTLIYASIFAKIIRLYLEINVIHLDLNDGNILIYPNGKPLPSSPTTTITITSNPFDVIFIDFGDATILSDGKDDIYFNIAQKNVYMSEMNEKILTPLNSPINEIGILAQNKKATIVQTIIKYLMTISDLAMEHKLDKIWNTFTNTPKTPITLKNSANKLNILRILNNGMNDLKDTIKPYIFSYPRGTISNINTNDVFTNAYDLLKMAMTHSVTEEDLRRHMLDKKVYYTPLDFSVDADNLPIDEPVTTPGKEPETEPSSSSSSEPVAEPVSEPGKEPEPEESKIGGKRKTKNRRRRSRSMRKTKKRRSRSMRKTKKRRRSWSMRNRR
jgi:hypothetical protein